MSQLDQDQTEKKTKAPSGEELTKGSSHIVVASIIAAVVVTLVIAAVVKLGEKPPMAVGEIAQVWAHARHVETSGYDANGAPIPKEKFDQVLVIAHVKLRNQSKAPLFLHEILTNATLDDGIHSSYAAFPGDYDRVFIVYPELEPLHGKGLSPEATIDPGQTVEGNILSAFRLTKAQWDARKDLSFSFNFRYQHSLELKPLSAVTEQ